MRIYVKLFNSSNWVGCREIGYGFHDANLLSSVKDQSL